MSINEITGDSIRTGNRKEDHEKLAFNWSVTFGDKKAEEVQPEVSDYKVIWASDTAVFKKPNKLMKLNRYITFEAFKEALELADTPGNLTVEQVNKLRELNELANGE